jgi:LPXTG-motif cell wall-anchored protein
MVPLIAGIIGFGGTIIGAISNTSVAKSQADAAKANAQAAQAKAQAQYNASLVAAQSKSSTTTWLVIGGIAVAGIIAVVLLRKKG